MGKNVTVTWKKDPVTTAQVLSDASRNKLTNMAMQEAAKPIKDAYVQLVPTRYGFLKKAIRQKVRRYKNGEKHVLLVGPTRAFLRVRGKRTRGENVGQPIKHRPAKYSHLLDEGTKHIVAQNFKGKALDRGGHDFAERFADSYKKRLAAAASPTKK